MLGYKDSFEVVNEGALKLSMWIVRQMTDNRKKPAACGGAALGQRLHLPLALQVTSHSISVNAPAGRVLLVSTLSSVIMFLTRRFDKLHKMACMSKRLCGIAPSTAETSWQVCALAGCHC